MRVDGVVSSSVGEHVEIGSLRERVEVLEVPERHGRIGRIRHANGENSAIDYGTWVLLRTRAALADEGSDGDAASDVLVA